MARISAVWLLLAIQFANCKPLGSLTTTDAFANQSAGIHAAIDATVQARQEKCDDGNFAANDQTGIFDWGRVPQFPRDDLTLHPNCRAIANLTDDTKLPDLCKPASADGLDWRCHSCNSPELLTPSRNETEVWKVVGGEQGMGNLLHAWYHPDRLKHFRNFDFTQFVFHTFRQASPGQVGYNSRCSEVALDFCGSHEYRCGDLGLPAFGVEVLDGILRTHATFKTSWNAIEAATNRMRANKEVLAKFVEQYDYSAEVQKRKDIVNSLFIFEAVVGVASLALPIAGQAAAMAVSSGLAKATAGLIKEGMQDIVKNINRIHEAIQWSSRQGRLALTYKDDGKPEASQLNAEAAFDKALQWRFVDAQDYLRANLRGLLRGDDAEGLGFFFELAKSSKGTEVLLDAELMEDSWSRVTTAQLIQEAWSTWSDPHFKPFILASPKIEGEDCPDFNTGASWVNFASMKGDRRRAAVNEAKVCDLPDYNYYFGAISDASRITSHRKDGKDAFYALPNMVSMTEGNAASHGGWTMRDVVINAVNAWWINNCDLKKNATDYIRRSHFVSEDGIPKMRTNLDKRVADLLLPIDRHTPGLWRIPIVYDMDGNDGAGLAQLERWVNWNEGINSINPAEYRETPGCPFEVDWIQDKFKKLAREAQAEAQADEKSDVQADAQADGQ